MSRAIVLDTGLLGVITNPKVNANHSLVQWYQQRLNEDVTFVIPEIADYELRRELVRAGLQKSLDRLDQLERAIRYLPLTTPAMRRGAQLWAKMRNEHTHTADDKALDGDVILAAQAEMLQGEFDEIVVATDNIGHLALLAPAHRWSDI